MPKMYSVYLVVGRINPAVQHSLLRWCDKHFLRSDMKTHRNLARVRDVHIWHCCDLHPAWFNNKILYNLRYNGYNNFIQILQTCTHLLLSHHAKEKLTRTYNQRGNMTPPLSSGGGITTRFKPLVNSYKKVGSKNATFFCWKRGRDLDLLVHLSQPALSVIHM